MRSVIVAAFLSVALPVAAQAASSGSGTATERSVIGPLLGNTLSVSNGSDAEVVHELYKADHTWVLWMPAVRPNRGNSYERPRFSGAWEMKSGGLLCVTYRRSGLHPHEVRCEHMQVHQVGDSWKTADGQTVTLLAGVH